LFVSVIILINAYLLARPAAAELMDAAPSPEIEGHVRKVASGVDGVRGTHKCHIRKTGKRLFIDLHVRVDERISVKAGHDIGHAVKKALMDDDPRVVSVLIHVEPED
jgi:cation diffusion facilitator family transporter